MDMCINNHKKSSTTAVREHIPSDFSVSRISSFKDIKHEHDLYRGKSCTKMFCECLKKHRRRIINFKKIKVKLLTNAQ